MVRVLRAIRVSDLLGRYIRDLETIEKSTKSFYIKSYTESRLVNFEDWTTIVGEYGREKKIVVTWTACSGLLADHTNHNRL